MNTKYRRTLAALLASAATLTMIPAIPTSAASCPVSVESIVTNRLEEICDVFVGTRFTTTGEGCLPYYESGHGCDTCRADKVVASGHFIRSSEQLTWIDNLDINASSGQWSCFAFAEVVLSLLYGNGKDYVEKNPHCYSYSFTYNNLCKFANIGDHLRFPNGHSVILLSFDKDSITVLDNNSTDTFNNLIKVRKLPYSYSGSFIPYGPTEASREALLNEYSLLEYNSDFAKAKPKFNINLRCSPYSASKIVGTVAAGVPCNITAVAVNNYGNLWYKLEVGGVVGWSSADNFIGYQKVEPTVENLTIEDLGNAARITWDENAYAAKYEVFYKNRSGYWVQEYDYQNGCSFISTGLTRDNIEFKVIVVDKMGVKHDPAYITYRKATTTVTPTINSVDYVKTGTNVNIEWSSTGASYYKVEYLNRSNRWVTDVDFTNAYNQKYTSTGVSRTIEYRITPYNATGTSGNPYYFTVQ